jgi:NAD(P)-dependent dehydrogenase (short-subunit alcohol dehydrogenase family)
MSSLKGKTLFISGASRGIGLAIALRAAHDGANVAIAAKTAEAHPKLKGTISRHAEIVLLNGRDPGVRGDHRHRLRAALGRGHARARIGRNMRRYGNERGRQLRRPRAARKAKGRP